MAFRWPRVIGRKVAEPILTSPTEVCKEGSLSVGTYGTLLIR